MGGKGVAQGMRRHPFDNACPHGCPLYSPLQIALVQIDGAS
jgi:hypothetical protein